MKILWRLVSLFGVGGLIIASVLSFMAVILLTASVLFNFSPFFEGKNGGGFGLGGYEKGGIPFQARISQTLPDTSIYFQSGNGSGMYYSTYQHKLNIRHPQEVLYADTIITSFENYNTASNSYQILGASVEEGKIFIKPTTFGQRVWLNLPMILKIALISYCCWQLGMLLSMISSGNPFQEINFQRLLKAGWALIIVFIFLILFDKITNNSSSITPKFESSIENYRPPFQFSLQIRTYMDPSLLVVGCIFVILSAAFRKGLGLQQEQELTV